MISNINFAGGEPVLYPGLMELVDYAYSLGFALSVISNDSLLLNEHSCARRLFQQLTTLGISVDSVNPNTLHVLGCCHCHENVLTQEKLMRLLQIARHENPRLMIKLNTVVTRFNVGERLVALENILPI